MRGIIHYGQPQPVWDNSETEKGRGQARPLPMAQNWRRACAVKPQLSMSSPERPSRRTLALNWRPGIEPPLSSRREKLTPTLSSPKVPRFEDVLVELPPAAAVSVDLMSGAKS